MKRLSFVFCAFVLAVFVMGPAAYAADITVQKLSDVLSKAPAEKFWQVRADDVSAMIQAKKTDFLIVDVRPNPGEFAEGHIPGAISIPVQDILKADNLKKLPKNKKVILACVTGQTQNLPVVALRALGYDAYTVSFGYSSWIKDYRGGKLMQEAIQGAASKNFPVVK